MPGPLWRLRHNTGPRQLRRALHLETFPSKCSDVSRPVASHSMNTRQTACRDHGELTGQRPHKGSWRLHQPFQLLPLMRPAAVEYPEAPLVLEEYP